MFSAAGSCFAITFSVSSVFPHRKYSQVASRQAQNTRSPPSCSLTHAQPSTTPLLRLKSCTCSFIAAGQPGLAPRHNRQPAQPERAAAGLPQPDQHPQSGPWCWRGEQQSRRRAQGQRPDAALASYLPPRRSAGSAAAPSGSWISSIGSQHGRCREREPRCSWIHVKHGPHLQLPPPTATAYKCS